MATDLHDLSVAELSGLIAARKLSPVELADALIQRVEQYDGQTILIDDGRWMIREGGGVTAPR